MQIAIVGLAGSGKTTVFSALTGGHAETGGYGGVTLNVGVVKVPDQRLDALAAIFKPKKIIQADVTYADLPAPPPSTEGHVGTEELPADHLARLRDSDALLHVVRAFEDPANPHPAGSVDPARDLEQLDLEFLLADLSMAERRIERLKTSARHGNPAEREAAEREDAVLRRIHAGLETGAPIRDLALDPDRRAGRGPGLADPGRLERRRRRRGDPHGPRQGLHPRRDRGLRRPVDARLDGRGAQGRPVALRGQDLPGARRRCAGDPLQQ